MAKDPAFLFYPGDYLKDTQCLNEKQQVSYDRIMCEHMRNICEDMSKIGISQARLNFFTKSLSEAEKIELCSFLVKKNDIFQIEWVAESIAQRKSYTNSRSKNRKSKKENISKTYVSHMVIENEIVNEDVNNNSFGKSENLLSEETWNDFQTNITIEFIDRLCQVKLSESEVVNYWEAFNLNNKKKEFESFSDHAQHFRNWLKNQILNEKNKRTSTGSNQPLNRMEALNNW